MAGSSQHRCVFVGNIPYDATEEQLIQICEEVGPVVSFRLVIDRETGKPKGYGFCEYKDEETALSARRNLQGYEINGRQLRVDFAENDKNSDRNREQGRGGPGMVASLDPQKQFGGLAVVGDSGMQQPIGLSIALTASSIMAQALGGAQTGSRSNLGQPALVADPLTLHLAKMSRNQLNEIMSEMKVLATQNRERACQVLLMNPVLTKALFQAQIALKMITPQMLQKPNIRQAPGSLLQPLLQDNQQGQQPTVESLPGLAPITGMMQFSHQVQGQIPSGLLNPMVSNQHAAISQLPTQPQIQLPQLAQNPGLQQGPLPGQSGVANLSLIRPPLSGSLPVRPQNQVATSYVVKQPVHPHLSQHPGQMGAVNLGPNPPLVAASTFQPSILARPLLLDQNFQLSSSASSSIPDGRRVDIYPSFPSGLPEKASKAYDGSDLQTRPSKLARLDGGKSSLSVAGLDVSTTVSVPAQALDTSGGQMSKPEVPSDSVKHFPQLQLPPEVESALLQQVLNLTPEQLSSLPPDQQQQVIQLQQMLRPPS